MRIGELSELTGSSIRSLRYYESVGLMRPERTASGQRQFRTADVDRVRVIRRLLAVGLGTRAIADVLPCMTDPATQSFDLTLRLLRERERLAAEIRERTQMIDELDAIIHLAPPLLDSGSVAAEGVQNRAQEGVLRFRDGTDAVPNSTSSYANSRRACL